MPLGGHLSLSQLLVCKVGEEGLSLTDVTNVIDLVASQRSTSAPPVAEIAAPTYAV